MSIEGDLADAVVARLVPIVEGIVRDQLAPVLAALPPTLAPLKATALRYGLDGRTLVSRFPDAVVRVGRKIMFDTNKMRPADAATVAAAARAARGGA